MTIRIKTCPGCGKVTGMMTPTAEAGANKLMLSGNKFRFEAVI